MKWGVLVINHPFDDGHLLKILVNEPSQGCGLMGNTPHFMILLCNIILREFHPNQCSDTVNDVGGAL